MDIQQKTTIRERFCFCMVAFCCPALHGSETPQNTSVSKTTEATIAAITNGTVRQPPVKWSRKLLNAKKFPLKLYLTGVRLMLGTPLWMAGARTGRSEIKCRTKVMGLPRRAERPDPRMYRTAPCNRNLPGFIAGADYRKASLLLTLSGDLFCQEKTQTDLRGYSSDSSTAFQYFYNGCR